MLAPALQSPSRRPYGALAGPRRAAARGRSLPRPARLENRVRGVSLFGEDETPWKPASHVHPRGKTVSASRMFGNALGNAITDGIQSQQEAELKKARESTKPSETDLKAFDKAYEDHFGPSPREEFQAALTANQLDEDFKLALTYPGGTWGMVDGKFRYIPKPLSGGSGFRFGDPGSQGSGTSAQSVRAGDYGGSLERVAKDQLTKLLGRPPSQRQVNNYVGQLAELNKIKDPRKIQGDMPLLLPDASTPAATEGLGVYGRDIAFGQSLKQTNPNRIPWHLQDAYLERTGEFTQQGRSSELDKAAVTRFGKSFNALSDDEWAMMFTPVSKAVSCIAGGPPAHFANTSDVLSDQWDFLVNTYNNIHIPQEVQGGLRVVGGVTLGVIGAGLDLTGVGAVVGLGAGVLAASEIKAGWDQMWHKRPVASPVEQVLISTGMSPQAASLTNTGLVFWTTGRAMTLPRWTPVVPYSNAPNMGAVEGTGALWQRHAPGGTPALEGTPYSPSVVNQRSADFYKLYGDNPLRGTMSNFEARQWYLGEDAKILDALDPAASLEVQAKTAFDLRNANRSGARELMSDRITADRLYREEPNLTWDQLISSRRSTGLSNDDIYRSIINSSQKTRTSVNKLLGLE